MPLSLLSTEKPQTFASMPSNPFQVFVSPTKYYTKLKLNVKGTLNVSTAGTGLVYNDYAFYSIFKEIKLMLKSNVIFDWEPYMFYFMDAFLTENQSSYNIALPTIANFETAGWYSFNMVIPIHCDMAGFLKSEIYATMLSTHGLNENEAFFQITPNAITNIFSSATANPVATINDLEFYFQAEETEFNTNEQIRFTTPKFQSTSQNPSASGTDIRIALPANKLYRGLILEVLNPNTQIGSDTLIEYVSLMSGKQILIDDISWSAFKTHFYQNYPSTQIGNINTNGRVFIDFAGVSKDINKIVGTFNNYNVYFKFKTSGAMTINSYYWLTR